MKKENFRKMKPDRILLSEKRNYFLGAVRLHDISKFIDIKDQKVYYVVFKNGARTKLHFHEGGQILVVTQGRGMLVLYRKCNTRDERTKISPVSKSTLKSGDMVYIPKNIFHWHGALEGSQFAHIAFNTFTSKGKESKTIWYDSDFVSYATRIP